MAAQHYLFEDHLINDEEDYQYQMDKNEEKFRVWASKCFTERKKAFHKTILLSGFHEDHLSEWLAEQMGLLLAKSELD